MRSEKVINIKKFKEYTREKTKRMVKAKIDIDSIQHMNLFERFTAVRAKLCFDYGPSLIFVIQPESVSRVIGKVAVMRKLSSVLKRRIRIVASPYNNEDIEPFIKSVIWPIRFKKLIFNNGELTIIAGPQSKAALIGREKSRLNQLHDILKKYFEVQQIRIA